MGLRKIITEFRDNIALSVLRHARELEQDEAPTPQPSSRIDQRLVQLSRFVPNHLSAEETDEFVAERLQRAVLLEAAGATTEQVQVLAKIAATLAITNDELLVLQKSGVRIRINHDAWRAAE